MSVRDVRIAHTAEDTIPIARTTAILPPASGFWARLAAFATDIIILGLIGQIIGWAFSSWLFEIGPFGRLIGWPILLVYLGVLNSSLGQGQTLGKRLFKIVVRDDQGAFIGLPRSFLRAIILTSPFMLNGWQLPGFGTNPAVAWIYPAITLGVGSALAYTIVFNRTNRQGFHDMVCGSYVVRPSGEPVTAYPKTSGAHWAVSAMLIIVSLVVGIAGSQGGFLQDSRRAFGIDLAPLQDLRGSYASDPRFFEVSVSDTKTYTTDGPSYRVLSISAWHKGRLPDDQRSEVAAQLAETAFANYAAIKDIDLMSITILSAYDLGFANGVIRYTTALPVRERLEP